MAEPAERGWTLLGGGGHPSYGHCSLTSSRFSGVHFCGNATVIRKVCLKNVHSHNLKIYGYSIQLPKEELGA